MSYILDGRHRREGALTVKTVTARGRGRFQVLREGTKVYERVRSFEAKIEYRHGGRLLETGSTLWDFYGYGSCAEDAVREAEKAARRYGITRKSSLVVQVRLEETMHFLVRLSSGYKGCTYETERDGPRAVAMASFVAWDSRRGWRRVGPDVLRRYFESHREGKSNVE